MGYGVHDTNFFSHERPYKHIQYHSSDEKRNSEKKLRAH